MKTSIIVILLASFLIISCGKQDKSAMLQDLKQQRDEIDEQIEKLEQEISDERGDYKKHENPIFVKVEKIIPCQFNHFLEVQGTVESNHNVFVPPQSPGVVKRIYVKEGDKVTKNQLLAEIDGSIYEKSIEELQNGLDMAKTVFERQERLWKQEIGSEIQYLQAKNQKEALEKRMATLLEQYELTKIKAPISGTVDEIIIKEGEAAIPGLGAIRIVQLSALKIKAPISESYLNDVHKGDTVKVSLSSIDKTFTKTIDAVSQVINPDNRTFSIELRIPAKEKNIKPNMLSVLTIKDYSNPQALTVPINVVQKTGKESFLFIAKKDKNGSWIADKRVVHTGKHYNNKIEILNGIKKGEKVIVIGYQDLADGQKIVFSD